MIMGSGASAADMSHRKYLINDHPADVKTDEHSENHVKKKLWSDELVHAIVNKPGEKIRKSFLLHFHSTENAVLKAFGTGPKQKTVHTTSLRKAVQPPKEAMLPHPAAWLWSDPEWNLGMDEFGNTYYYNSSTLESSWSPPSHLTDVTTIPSTEMSFDVIVPDDAIPGQPFIAEIYGNYVQVMCPIDVAPGSLLELICPSDQDTTYAGFDFGASPADATETSNVAYDDSRPVDAKLVWEAFSQAGSFSAASLAQDAEQASAVVGRVSMGEYAPKDLFQLGWAYKFSIFQSSIFTCFKIGGDFSDSSPYDNCDGTPRYAANGFIEWYTDLCSQRSQLLDAMKVDGWANTLNSDTLTEKSLSEYSKLTATAIGGDDMLLMEGLLKRQQEAADTLQNLQSRSVPLAQPV